MDRKKIDSIKVYHLSVYYLKVSKNLKNKIIYGYIKRRGIPDQTDSCK